MATIARRRPYEPSWERERWRAELFRVYRRQTRYRNLILQDLRPDWLLVPEGARGSPIVRYHQLRRLAEEADSPAALRDYLGKVRRYVVHPLRLTARGAPGTPAGWACDYVHADVRSGVQGGDEARPLDPADAAAYPVPGGEIRLTVFVSPWAADWSCVGPGGASGDRRWPLTAGDPRDDHGGGRVDWDGLRGAVEAAVGVQLDAIADDFKRLYPNQRNAALDASRPDKLAALAGVLLLGDPEPDPQTQPTEHKSFCELARELGFAYPPAVSGKARP